MSSKSVLCKVITLTTQSSGVGHSYNMCRHLAVLVYLVRVRGEREGERESYSLI